MKKKILFILAASVAAMVSFSACQKAETSADGEKSADAKSTEAKLVSLTAIANETTYEAEIMGTDAQFTANPEDMSAFESINLVAKVSDKATCSISDTDVLDVVNGKVTITVVAEDGTTSKTYNVSVAEKQYTVSCKSVWCSDNWADRTVLSDAFVTYNGSSVAFCGTDKIALLDGTILDLEGKKVGSLNTEGLPSNDYGLRVILNDENGVVVAAISDGWETNTWVEVFAWIDGYDKKPVQIFSEHNEEAQGSTFRFPSCVGSLGKDFSIIWASGLQTGYTDADNPTELDQPFEFYVFKYGASTTEYEIVTLYANLARACGNWSLQASPASADLTTWFFGNSMGWPYDSSIGAGWMVTARTTGVDDYANDFDLYGTLEEEGGPNNYGCYSSGSVKAFTFNGTAYCAVASADWGNVYLTIQTANPEEEDHYLLTAQSLSYGANDPYTAYIYDPEADCGYVAFITGADGSDDGCPHSVNALALYKIERVGY